MGKYILYKENNDYKFTNEANYHARIANANQIATFEKDAGFETADDVIDYVCKYSKDVKPSDINVLTEGIGSANDESRFYGLVEQIDVLVNMVSENGSISPDQKSQLVDLRDHVAAFGERGAKWAQLCDDILARYSPSFESLMDFYAKFVGSFDCPPVLAEAAMRGVKEVLLEASESSNAAEQLRAKVGTNPNETGGVDVFGLSGDDNLPEQTTIDNEIADSMASGTFDALGSDIATANPADMDETLMGLGSSELDTSGNIIDPGVPDETEDAADSDVTVGDASEQSADGNSDTSLEL